MPTLSLLEIQDARNNALAILKRRNDSMTIPPSTNILLVMAEIVVAWTTGYLARKTQDEVTHAEVPETFTRETDPRFAHLSHLQHVMARDIATIQVKDREYGASWKRRGGIGAFMMMARKWDRLEPQAERFGYNIFAAIQQDTRNEGILDDMKDLRNYLLLIECEAIAQGWVK